MKDISHAGKDYDAANGGLGIGDQGDPAFTLDKRGNAGVLAVSENQRAEVLETPIMRQLTTGGGKPGQGYPTVRISGTQPFADRCAVDPQPDGRRYAACGDGVVAPVAEWIGRRLAAVAHGELEAAA